MIPLHGLFLDLLENTILLSECKDFLNVGGTCTLGIMQATGKLSVRCLFARSRKGVALRNGIMENTERREFPPRRLIIFCLMKRNIPKSIMEPLTLRHQSARSGEFRRIR